MQTKYHAKPITLNGIRFDSKKEARRYSELLLLEKAGVIQNLQRQVKYILIPAQREFSNEIYTKGAKKGCYKPGKLLEKECSYYADFVYLQGEKIVVEDAKGVRTEAYKIKKKLMLKEYGIQIKEL